MTSEQFNDLFAQHTYAEARDIIRAYMREHGIPQGANDSKMQLMQKVVDGIPTATMPKAKADTATGKDTPPPADCTSDTATPSDADAKAGDGATGGAASPSTSPSDEVKSEDGGAKTEDDSGEDELTKAIRDAEAEAKRRQEEAEAQKAKADAFKKRLEDLRKKLEEERKKKAKAGGKHYKTDELIDTLKTCGIAYLVGPAGTGKSTLAMDATKILFNVEKGTERFNKVFAQISFSPDTTSGEMIGRSDVHGNFHESEVVRVFRDGGLILFDEIDDADSAMLIKLNTALANGFIATPNGMVKRNENTYIVCTANTYGTGPDAMYVGRTRLDAATLDRFTLCTIEVDYDTKLEKCIAEPLSKENREWLLNFVKKVRKCIKDNHYRRLCTTRMVINATKFLANGKSTQFIQDRFLTGWDDAQKNAVKVAIAA